MKTMLACSIGMTALLIANTSLSAKGPTIKITINGVGLVTPIEIDEATVLAPFQPDGLRLDTLSPRIVYMVLYEHDASTGQGYVYLPTATDDERYAVNTSSIYRGLERHWFRATDSWDSVAGPLIARTVR